MKKDTSFEDTYPKNYKAVVDLLTSIRFNMQQDDAEDLAQEVMLKAHRRWTELDQSRDPMPWFHMLAEGAYKDHSRVEGRREKYEQASIPNEDEDYSDSKMLNPETTTSREEEQRISISTVNLALAEMSPIYREIINLVDIEGEDVKYAAEILGIRFWAAKKRLYRARRLFHHKIYSKLGVDGGFEEDE